MAGWMSIVVIPISTAASQDQRGPTVVAIPAGVAGLTKASFAVCHQIATLEGARLTRWIGGLPAEIMEEVELALKAAMDLD